MKLKFLLQLTLFISMAGYAQNGIKRIDKFPHSLYLGNLIEDDFFEQSNFIFEGKLLSHKTFLNEDTTKVWTSSIYEVVHVFKGGKKIKKGTIEIVRDCGVYVGQGCLGQRTIILDYNNDYSLFTAGHMIFFCTKSPVSYQKTENIAVQPLRNELFAAFYYSDSEREHNFKIFGFHDLYFKTLEDFYEYMGKHQGIQLPKSYLLQKKNLKNTTQPQKSHEEYIKNMLQKVEQSKKNTEKYKNKRKQLNTDCTKTTANNKIALSIENLAFIGTHIKYLEFDMFAKANNSKLFSISYRCLREF